MRVFFVLSLALMACRGDKQGEEGVDSATAPSSEPMRVLVFTKTTGWRHTSIPEGITAFEQLGERDDWDVFFSEDETSFTDAVLAAYDVVVFLQTTGDVLEEPGHQAAFERYIQAGGGYVGIHSASDTEYDWDWYGDLVGAYFDSHVMGTQEETVLVADRSHPSTAHLADHWVRTDEWYSFKSNPRGTAHVLMTQADGEMGHDHPIAWCQNYDGGRSWYTALGHTDESYVDQVFLDHMVGGVMWAAGRAAGDCDASRDDAWTTTVLDDSPMNPLKVDVDANGLLYYVERAGAVKRVDPTGPSTTLLGTLDAFVGEEEGLVGMVLDPSFTSNGWMYLYWAPPDAVENRLSRYTVSGDTLDMASEKIVLRVPTQRDSCCHTGGGMAFDDDGNLYLATGDNVSAHDSAGYVPADERPGNEWNDAQGTAGNSMDLRGKLLRIKPSSEGGYAIPSGNMFTGDDGQPEIFAMGVRNPYTLVTHGNTVYWAEVGPDAYVDSETRGSRGYDEINRATAPANFGWPYCIADNQPYGDHDFATGVTGNLYDCDGPTNNSPNNTGLTSLPAAEPAWIYYAYSDDDDWPQIDARAGRTAIIGPVLNPSGRQNDLPDYYRNTLLIADWMHSWIMEVKLDDSGEVLAMHPFANSLELKKPIDFAVGPQGELYVIEYGSGWADNDDAAITQVVYDASHHSPED